MNGDNYTIQIQLTGASPLTIQLSEGKPLVAGSSWDADIHLPTHFVSRRHFQLEIINGRVFITDLDSRNGTYLNGTRLTPHQPQEWVTGGKVNIADSVQARLISPQAMPVLSQPRLQSEGTLEIALYRPNMRPNRPIPLTISYQGGLNEQQVYLRGHSLVEGLEFVFKPSEHFVPPGGTVNTGVQIRKLKPFWLGGRFPVILMAMTADGLFARTEAIFRTRPRYELLLLLLLLIMPLPFLALRPEPLVAALPTATSTSIPASITQSPTGTLFPTFTPTSIPSATLTLTPFPSATSCFNQCAAVGWPRYIVQPGDTLSSLANAANVSLAQAASVNCIANANVIQVGQQICLPLRSPLLTAQATCDRVNFIVTFTVFNDGGPMLSADIALIRDNTGFDLIAPALFQLGAGRAQTFQFGYRSRPGYTGSATFSILSGRLLPIVNANCVPPIVTVTPLPQASNTPLPFDTLTPTFTPVPFVDIVAGGLSLDGAVTWDTGCGNASIPLSFAFSNSGNLTSDTFYNQFSIYSEPTLGGSILTNGCGGDGSSCGQFALGPGEGASLPDTLFVTNGDVSTTGDTLYAVANADAGVDVAELNEGNNQSSTLPFDVPVCVIKPTLFVGTATVVNMNECDGSTLGIDVDFKVANSDGIAVNSFTTLISVSVDYGSGATTLSQNVTLISDGNLIAGGSESFSGHLEFPQTSNNGEFPVQIVEGRPIEVNISIDTTNNVAESDETDNLYITTVFTSSCIDIAQ